MRWPSNRSVGLVFHATLLAALACSSSPTDADMRPGDASSTSDSPHTDKRDAGPHIIVTMMPVDAGTTSDAKHRGDAHTTAPDAGTPNDTGTAPDTSTATDGGTVHDSGGGAASGLHVVIGTSGAAGHIVDGSGNVVQLHGVDRSGSEYACIQGWGFFDGPVDQTSITAMKSWNVDAVRVPLNEDCWLNINGVSATYGGANYIAAIQAYVSLLIQNGMVVILDLHWTAPGTEEATGQLPMADSDHAPAFWSSVAKTFANNPSIVFDLFNEPYITDWTCWAAGGSCANDANNTPYQVAGMAALLQAVRQAGANNVVIMGGLGYSSEFSGWVSAVESIPTLAAPLNGLTLDNVAASWHVYDFNATGCPSQYNSYSGTCDTAAATAMATSITSVLAAGYPFITGESGISAYQSSTPFSTAQVMMLESWYTGVLAWIRAQGQSYLAWDWNTDGDPFLLTDYTGTPTPGFGVTYQGVLAGL
jgi:endoglucanase